MDFIRFNFVIYERSKNRQVPEFLFMIYQKFKDLKFCRSWGKRRFLWFHGGSETQFSVVALAEGKKTPFLSDLWLIPPFYTLLEHRSSKIKKELFIPGRSS